jgi:hypothetical protein
MLQVQKPWWLGGLLLLNGANTLPAPQDRTPQGAAAELLTSQHSLQLLLHCRRFRVLESLHIIYRVGGGRRPGARETGGLQPRAHSDGHMLSASMSNPLHPFHTRPMVLIAPSTCSCSELLLAETLLMQRYKLCCQAEQ